MRSAGDHRRGEIVAEGTPDSLKRQISGDVVTLELEAGDNEPELARGLLSDQSFVCEIEAGEGELRLYVERGEKSMLAIVRLLDGSGLGVRGISLSRPTPDDVFLQRFSR